MAPKSCHDEGTRPFYTATIFMKLPTCMDKMTVDTFNLNGREPDLTEGNLTLTEGNPTSMEGNLTIFLPSLILVNTDMNGEKTRWLHNDKNACYYTVKCTLLL